MILGINGYVGSGKNAVADIMTEEFGFEQIAFADKLRECMYILNPIVGHENPQYGLLGLVYLRDVIDEYGWQGVKLSRYAEEVRRLLQTGGTEMGRETLGENIWRDATFAVMSDTNSYVITDCRFPNEARGILYRGGKMWRVNRPGIKPANNHASDTSLDDWDFDAVINNDGSLTDLRESVRLLLK